jgi:hypothetical protein
MKSQLAVRAELVEALPAHATSPSTGNKNRSRRKRWLDRRQGAVECPMKFAAVQDDRSMTLRGVRAGLRAEDESLVGITITNHD